MSDQRCKHDLPLDGCGYCSTRPKVVGIRQMETTEARRRATRRPAGTFAGQWGGAFSANYPGNCAICGDRYGSGTLIRRLLDATSPGYAEDTCVSDDDE